MIDFFSWITSLSEKISTGGDNEDYVDFYANYFEHTSVCSNILIASFAISLVIALLYYFIICNKFFYLAKRIGWGIVLIITFATTYFVTDTIVVGQDNEDPGSSSGIFFSSYQTETFKLNETLDDKTRASIQETAESFREIFESGEESLPTELSLVNSFYAIIFFFIFSLIFKRHTVHGSAIPF